VYTVADAVVLGNLLITLLKNSDRVTSASLAQLVNVIAPIMTDPGGGAWRQTTFFPFSATSRLARGRVLRPRITTTQYDTAVYGPADLIDSVATFDDESDSGAVFLVNRDEHREHTVTIDASGLGASRILESLTLSDDDYDARNTIDDRERVGLGHNPTAALSAGTITVTLPPVSWTAVSFLS
jgi:alpha-N-arabinofuranosidase